MPYVIAEPCITVKDRSCVDVCPVDCIYEGEDQLYIHPDECIDCGACVPECPVTARSSSTTRFRPSGSRTSPRTAPQRNALQPEHVGERRLPRAAMTAGRRTERPEAARGAMATVYQRSDLSRPSRSHEPVR